MRAKQVGSTRTAVGVQLGMYTVLEKGRKKTFLPKGMSTGKTDKL